MAEPAPPQEVALQRVSLDEQIRFERDRFVAFAFAGADILLELDESLMIRFADGATHGLLGYSSEALTGMAFTDLCDSTIADKLREQLLELSTKHRLDRQSVSLNSAYGDPIPFLLSGFRISKMHQYTYLSLSLLKGELSLEHILKRDIDTGLLKTSGFVESASQAISQAREKGEAVSITLWDFPQLQAFLDQLPKEQAEALLKEISAYLREHSLGGDNAAILSDQSFSVMHDPSHDPKAMLEDLINMTRRYDPTGAGIEVNERTISADVPLLTTQDTANVLLYTLTEFAQHTGDDFSITSLSESYEQLLEDTMKKITNFKQVITADQFKLAFQPIVDLKSGLIHHFEVLVRVNDAEVFQNPYEFITFGEKAGVISDFDLAMTQRAFEVLHKTAVKGNRPVIAINISGKSISSIIFRDSLKRIIDDNKKFRKQLIFELTESARIEDMHSANEFLQELRQGGNLCCLDDFGTGESSFDYLRSLQVDFIKIDGTYVKESLKTTRGRHMLKAMASLCRDLQVTTIGEMVEDEQAATILWESGVKFGQGYLFGKPDIDEEALINCKKPTPFFGGMMRARKIDNKTPKWSN